MILSYITQAYAVPSMQGVLSTQDSTAMSIHVKFFASLRERLGREAQEIEASDGLTIGALWCAASGTDCLPANVLAALNHEYATPDQQVRDGDEVAFFPPVTGG